ncbi:MAG: M24 family metallopeptidase [Arsenophonus sp. NEOnobi-MAG3]
MEIEAIKENVLFLIDTGSEYHGYAADITATLSYAAKNNNEFANLINDLDSKKTDIDRYN